MSRTRLKCRLLWKLCRKHGWGSPVPESVLIDLALGSSDQGEGATAVRELADEPYIRYREGRGYSVKNDPDAQAQAACRLVSTCEYLEIQVEPTLSRFEQAGGFDAYDEREIRAELADWG